MTGIVVFNERLLLWVNSLVGRSSLLDSFMRMVVNDYFIPVSLALSLLALWFMGQTPAQRERHQRAIFCASISIGITSAVVKILNLFYSPLRPFQKMPELLPTVDQIFYRPHDPSFPSNAAAIGFAVATAVWLGNRRLGGFLFLLASLLSIARVYAGVHYPGDVVGGAVLGALCSILIFKISPWLEPLPTWLLKIARKLCLA